MVVTLKVKECYTPMTNFILKYTGTDQPDMKKVTAALHAHQVHVLDGSMLPDMALVQLDETRLDALRIELDEKWNVYPEKNYRVPSTKKKIRKDNG